MFKTIKSTAPLLALGTVMFAGSALAASGTTNRGSEPQGQPFVEINDQIVEVQGQILTLEQKVQQLVEEGGTIDGIWAKIDALEAETDTLQAQLAGTEDSGLSLQIEHNLGLIEGLQEAVFMLQEDVAKRQMIVGGRCPAGESLVAVNSSSSVNDGSVVCEATGSAAPGISVVHVYAVKLGGNGLVTALCPAGYVVTGGTSFGRNDKYGIQDGPSGFVSALPSQSGQTSTPANGWTTLVHFGTTQAPVYPVASNYYVLAVCMALTE